MSLDILEDPFASSASISLSKQEVREAAPALPDTKLNDLADASDQYSFDMQEGVNERFLLNKEYMHVASNISAELGPFTLDQFATAQPIVEAGTLRLLNEGDNTGSFRGTNASGGSQYDLLGLSPSSFDGNGISARPYTANGGSSSDIIDDTLDTNTQSAFILGYYQTTNPRSISHVEVNVDDGETRNPHEVYSHMSLGTLQAVDAPSIEYLEENDSAVVSVSTAGNSDVDTDFYPYGVNINTADNLLADIATQ